MATTSTAYAELLNKMSGPDTTGYSSPYAEDIASLLRQTQEQQTYASPYADTLAALTGEMENAKFTYDRDSDPNWQEARKQYLRDADRAASDVLAKASAATNGRASSYAITAASQAADYYKSQLTAQQLALYDAAYQRYAQEFARKKSLADSLLAQEQVDYNRWNNEYANLLDRLGVLQEQEKSDYSRWYAETTDAYKNLVSLIASTGYTPSEAERTRAGMSAEEAAAWRSYYLNSQSSGSGGRYYGSSSGTQTKNAETPSVTSGTTTQQYINAIRQANAYTGTNTTPTTYGTGGLITTNLNNGNTANAYAEYLKKLAQASRKQTAAGGVNQFKLNQVK